MDRDTELTAYLLRYLHDNHYFKSMEEMAEKFDISKRHVQRLVNNAESLKGGSIALSKILQYFGLHNIPFEPILLEFVSKTVRRNEASEIQLEKPYLRIKLPQPSNLTTEGLAAYEYPDASGTMYTCNQAHTSQTGWEPPVVPALWTAQNESGDDASPDDDTGLMNDEGQTEEA